MQKKTILSEYQNKWCVISQMARYFPIPPVCILPQPSGKTILAVVKKLTDMSKLTYAFIFAFAGGLLALMISGDASVALFCASMGVLVGCFIYGLRDAKSAILQEDFQKLGDLRGRTIEEIVAAVGPYNSWHNTVITDLDNAPGVVYTWTESRYQITLLFGDNNRCIGVSSETRI